MNGQSKSIRFRRIVMLSLLLLATSLCTCYSQEVLVADGGKSEYRIVLPSQPKHEESFAASELQKYLKLATGAKLPVVKSDSLPAGKCLIVACADTKLAKSVLAAPNTPKLKEGEEAFLVATVSDDIVFTGRAPHAVIYAVYDFLEDSVGYAWLFPGDLGEEVPTVRTLRIGKLRRSQAPSFPFRWIGSGEWALRSKMNMRVRAGRERTGVSEVFGGHSFCKVLPAEQYFDSRPDFFALVAGLRKRSRSKGHGDQICTSNPAAVREVVKNMRTALDANPAARIISLSPNDGLGFCECDNCMKLDEPGKYNLIDVQRGRAVPREERIGILSARMLRFYNQVARELAKTHPQVMVKSFAYSLYVRPPKDRRMRCEPNLMIQLCHGACHNHPLTDPDCPYNRDYLAALEGWDGIGQHLAIYEYYWKVSWVDLPWPILHSIRQDIPQYHRMGVKLLYTQFGRNYAGGFGPIYYIVSRLLWDVNADVDALLAHFCGKAYGKAGDTMRRYYMFWEDTVQATGIHASVNLAEACLEVFSSANLATAAEMLTEASELADSAKARQRVERVAAQLEYTKLASQYVHALKAIRDRYPVHWVLEQDAAVNSEIDRDATPIVAKIRAFLDANQDTAVVHSRRNNYITRFITPRRVMSVVDTIGSDREREVLTADAWLASGNAPKLPRRKGLPERFDLWVYGYDLDTDGKGSEHDLFLVTPGGERHLLAKLAPPDEDGNRTTRCYVVKDIDAGGQDPAALRLVLTNHPEGWSSSTMLAYFLMPHLPDVTNQQATILVRHHLDWVRAASGGFLEYSRKGLKNDDGAQEQITIPVIGMPKQPPVIPRLAKQQAFQPTVTFDNAKQEAMLENSGGRFRLAKAPAFGAGPLISRATSQTLVSRLGLSLSASDPFQFAGPGWDEIVALSDEKGERVVGRGTAHGGEVQLILSVDKPGHGFGAALAVSGGAPSGAMFFPVIETPAPICTSVVYVAENGETQENAEVLSKGGTITLGSNWFALRNLDITDEGTLFILPKSGLKLHVRPASRREGTRLFAVELPRSQAGGGKVTTTLRLVPFRGREGHRRILKQLETGDVAH